MKELKHGEIFKIGKDYFKLKVVERSGYSKGRILAVYVRRLKDFEEAMELPLDELKEAQKK